MALPKEEIKTIADIEALPEGTRAELIDGRLFLDTAPTVTHQAIVNFLVTEINIYIALRAVNAEFSHLHLMCSFQPMIFTTLFSQIYP